jgi:hypothetical protein
MRGWRAEIGKSRELAPKGAFRTGLRALGLAALGLLLAAPVVAGTDLPLLGPVNFDRHQGAPTVYTESFERCEPSDQALLRVWNGDGKVSRITAAQIFVNGIEIFGEKSFKQQDDYLEAPITAAKVNDLKVVLKSGDFKVPAFLRIGIVGRNCDVTPPLIASPQPADGALLATATPHVAASYVDEAGGAGIDPASVHLTLDGADVTAGPATAIPVSVTTRPPSARGGTPPAWQWPTVPATAPPSPGTLSPTPSRPTSPSPACRKGPG